MSPDLAGPSARPVLLRVEGLRTTYTSKGQKFSAVDDVSFEIAENETIGLVGESGCGKSSLGKTVARLLKPEAGSIMLQGIDIAAMGERELRPARRSVQMVFQDPYASLNPRQSIYRLLDTPLRVQGVKSSVERRRLIHDIAERIGFSPEVLGRYPHEFSGGQRQRIGIARALILKPRLVICDEPVSALDVSIQAQIINLLVELKRGFGLSYLFISHDLSVVRYLSDRILVMYLGQIVESLTRDVAWREARHPYTRALLGSVPRADPSKKIGATLAGEIARAAPAKGCRFQPRCPLAVPRCAVEAPSLRKMADGNAVACHLA